MSTPKPRRRHRALKAVLLIILAALLYSVVGGYAPFARTPGLSDAAVIQARVDEMCRDQNACAERATILETRPQALDERVRLINQAERDLVIASYDCRDGESTRDVLCAALARADDGVRVRILVDGISGRVYLAGSEVFRAVNGHENVEIRFYNPPSPLMPWRYMGRMHDKYVIADDTAYILGGRNMFDHFLGNYPSVSGTYSNDREALVYAGGDAEGSIRQVRDYFEGMWSHARTAPFTGSPLSRERREAVLADLAERRKALMAEKPDLFAPADYPAMTLPTKGVWLVSNPTNIGAKEPVVFSTLCALMARAKEGVVIHSPYCVLNAVMREKLSQIAASVPVTLMINAVENGANVVAGGDYLYHRGEVLATGMSVLEYAGGDSYHGKSLAIDGDVSVIGSFNLDLRSTYVDTELMLVISGEEVNALLRGHMEALHADCRRVIDAEHAEVPEGLDIPPLPAGRRLAMRLIGGAMQLFRNLV